LNLEKRRAEVLAEIATPGDFRRGSIAATGGRRGTPGCHCHKPDDPGHGPSATARNGSELLEKIRSEAGYFDNNRDRMHYPEFRAQHLFIGSGVIEAGCKTIIGSRCKQSGAPL